MKQKLIIKETGKSVEVGDILEIHYHQIKKDGTEIIGVSKHVLTEENIPRFIKKGILTVQTFGEPSRYNDVHTDVQHYFNKINATVASDLKSFGIYMHDFMNITNILASHYPAVIFQLLLRQIALELDHRYEGDISKSDKVFVVGITDGAIRELNKAVIKNFRNFAAFRTKEDAEFAKSVLKGFYKRLYGKQEN